MDHGVTHDEGMSYGVSWRMTLIKSGEVKYESYVGRISLIFEPDLDIFFLCGVVLDHCHVHGGGVERIDHCLHRINRRQARATLLRSH